MEAKLVTNILIAVISFSLASLYFIIENKRKKNSKKLEAQFLVGSLYLLQYKYHMLQMLELIYEKAGETDPKFLEDYKKIIEKIEQKTDEFGQEWFSGLQNVLEHETKYKNWKEVTKYFNETLKNAQSKKTG
jgi:DNA phosphorothioation-dependent restriction protein DptG